MYAVGALVPVFAAVIYTHPDFIKKHIVSTSFVNYPRAADYASMYNADTKADVSVNGRTNLAELMGGLNVESGEAGKNNWWLSSNNGFGSMVAWYKYSLMRSCYADMC